MSVLQTARRDVASRRRPGTRRRDDVTGPRDHVAGAGECDERGRGRRRLRRPAQRHGGLHRRRQLLDRRQPVHGLYPKAPSTPDLDNEH